MKFDGYRLLPRIADGRAQLFTRSGLDWTARMPALARTLSALPLKNAWLDGEVVHPDANGLPDFAALQASFDSHRADALVLYLFDLLYLDGVDWRSEPLALRRARLSELLADISSPMLRLSQSFDADPRSLLKSAARMGMEGIIGKQRQAPYHSGRSNAWIKLKTRQSDELLIAGFTPGQGARSASGDIGALVLAGHDAHGALRHAGNVGSGFSSTVLAMLKKRLMPLRIDRSPLAQDEHVAGLVHWVNPELAVQIAHAGVTPQGRLRQPVYLGLREDKPPSEITLPEVPATGAAMNQKTPPTPAKAVPAVAGQNITHPERVVDASTGVTKLDVARYYATVAPLILPHLAWRPVALLRAPEGIGKETFFQKHMESIQLPGVKTLDMRLDPGHAGLLEISHASGLLGAVQMNSLEFHTWNATRDKIERPDRFTLDLDPGKGVAWPQVQEAAQLVHTLLTELGLVPFLKTSGGKGLHVVVPIKRLYGWDTVKAFSKMLTEHLARLIPDRFVALSGPKNRIGKIYVDYLRNGRGATTVSAWSARARPGMGVSVPIAWSELEEVTSGAHWHLGNIESRLRVGNTPWKDYAKAAQPIGSARRQLNAAK
ncbi:DNA ligase D [Ottowia sp. VDI28]|uniref:DNA ligase D n=1 Tax=Ottowia sp. VDI28 TaxID=3133968 RepID=UPI003C2FBE2B